MILIHAELKVKRENRSYVDNKLLRRCYKALQSARLRRWRIECWPFRQVRQPRIHYRFPALLMLFPTVVTISGGIGVRLIGRRRE